MNKEDVYDAVLMFSAILQLQKKRIKYPEVFKHFFGNFTEVETNCDHNTDIMYCHPLIHEYPPPFSSVFGHHQTLREIFGSLAAKYSAMFTS